MKLNNTLLFIIPALIWGSTWFVIKFQLGEVDPILSVSYRFGLAAIVLCVYAYLRSLKMKYSAREHRFFLLQGFLLFGTNYWLVYLSELYLTSGLVAVGFSLLIFLNIFFNWLFLKTPVKKGVLIGGVLGVSGTIFIFLPEFMDYTMSDNTLLGLIFLGFGILSASLGNIVSAFNQRQGLPVVQTNAYGMLYGSLLMFLIALATGKTIVLDTSFEYLFSLSYLAVFGSVIAFTTYLTLIGRIGPDKAAYVMMVLPAIALTISVIYENYQVTTYAVIGVILIFMGNFLALRKPKFS